MSPVTTIRDFFDQLSSCCTYLVLRNWDDIFNENVYGTSHEDIDILCDDLDFFVQWAHAHSIHSDAHRNNYVVWIGRMNVRFDVRYVGDGYYPKAWAASMLRRRVMTNTGIYVMCAEDYAYSLAYHALLQKPSVSDEYLGKVQEAMQKLDAPIQVLGASDLLSTLKRFCHEKHYTIEIPSDPGVYLNWLNILKIRTPVGIVPLLRRIHFQFIKYYSKKVILPIKESQEMPSLPQYQSWEEKEQQYAENTYIDTEQQLDCKLQELERGQTEWLFRGVNDARFKMYSLGQRHWLLQTDRMKRVGQTDYFDAIETLIRRTEMLPEVQAYMAEQLVESNDMFLLALMQHFGVPSPMLDFSHSLWTGLFFAVDGMSEWEDHGGRELEDYVSLYYIANRIDWVRATVQAVMENAAESLQQQVSDFVANNPGVVLQSDEVRGYFLHLYYSQFRSGPASDIKFLPVGGPAEGRVRINVPVLNVNCDYLIINDRIVSQQGMFIMNNTVERPLAELMNGCCRCNYFHCLNIRKHLVPYIEEKYLKSKGIDHASVYCKNDRQAAQLETALGQI